MTMEELRIQQQENIGNDHKNITFLLSYSYYLYIFALFSFVYTQLSAHFLIAYIHIIVANV